VQNVGDVEVCRIGSHHARRFDSRLPVAATEDDAPVGLGGGREGAAFNDGEGVGGGVIVFQSTIYKSDIAPFAFVNQRQFASDRVAVQGAFAIFAGQGFDG